MLYTKPTILTTSQALSAIKGTPKSDVEADSISDPNTVQSNNGAYEADE